MVGECPWRQCSTGRVPGVILAMATVIVKRGKLQGFPNTVLMLCERKYDMEIRVDEPVGNGEITELT